MALDLKVNSSKLKLFHSSPGCLKQMDVNSIKCLEPISRLPGDFC
jgi:hypothetical protein